MKKIFYLAILKTNFTKFMDHVCPVKQKSGVVATALVSVSGVVVPVVYRIKLLKLMEVKVHENHAPL